MGTDWLVASMKPAKPRLKRQLVFCGDHSAVLIGESEGNLSIPEITAGKSGDQ
jgi:hypothetical protein